MTARVFKIENRLAKVIRLPGGRTMVDALRSATSRIESVRERCVASLDGQLVRLAGFAEQGRSGEAPAALDGLYRTANEIFSIAGTFDLRALSDAAYGLCDLVDGYRGEKPASWSAIDVHIDAMRLLASGAPIDGDAVVQGLRLVRQRVVSTET